MGVLKKIKKRYIILTTIIAISFLLFQIVQALATTTAAPGTDSDPLVSKSYVDKEVKDVTDSLGTLSAKIADLTTDNNDLLKKVNSLSTTVNQQASTIKDLNTTIDTLSKKITSTSQNTSFKAISIKAGKSLLTGTGTELIIILGKATIVSTTSGGVCDTTTGKDLKTGASASLNHLIISPLKDGRGLKAVTEIRVLIKGSYTIS